MGDETPIEEGTKSADNAMTDLPNLVVEERQQIGELQEALDAYLESYGDFLLSLRPWVRTAHFEKSLLRLLQRKNAPIPSNHPPPPEEMREIRNWAVDRSNRTLIYVGEVIDAYLQVHKSQLNSDLLHIRETVEKFQAQTKMVYRKAKLWDGIKYLVSGLISITILGLSVSDAIHIPQELILAMIGVFAGIPILLVIGAVAGTRFVIDLPWYWYQLKQKKISKHERKLLAALSPFTRVVNNELADRDNRRSIKDSAPKLLRT
jgi:hypothetical protein